MRQVLGRCKASKADDVVAYFEAFATQQKLMLSRAISNFPSGA